MTGTRSSGCAIGRARSSRATPANPCYRTGLWRFVISRLAAPEGRDELHAPVGQLHTKGLLEARIRENRVGRAAGGCGKLSAGNGDHAAGAQRLALGRLGVPGNTLVDLRSLVEDSLGEFVPVRLAARRHVIDPRDTRTAKRIRSPLA